MLFNLFKTNYEKLCSKNTQILNTITDYVKDNDNINLTSDKLPTIYCIELKVYNRDIIIKIAGCKSDVLFSYIYKGDSTNVRFNQTEIRQFNSEQNINCLKLKIEKLFKQFKKLKKYDQKIANGEVEIKDQLNQIEYLKQYMVYSNRTIANLNNELENLQMEITKQEKSKNDIIAEQEKLIAQYKAIKDEEEPIEKKKEPIEKKKEPIKEKEKLIKNEKPIEKKKEPIKEKEEPIEKKKRTNQGERRTNQGERRTNRGGNSGWKEAIEDVNNTKISGPTGENTLSDEDQQRINEFLDNS